MQMPAVTRPILPIPAQYWQTLPPLHPRPGHCRSCGIPVSLPHARGCRYLAKRRARVMGPQVRP